MISLTPAHLWSGLLAGAALCASALGAPQDAGFVLQPTSIHLADGSVLEGGHVVIKDGKIASVGAAGSLPEGASVTEVEGHLSAGMVALADSTGLEKERLDATRWLMPDAQVAMGFRRDHPDLARMTAGGVTTVVLTPGGRLLSGGRTAVVKPSGGELLSIGAHLHLNFSSEMFSEIEQPAQAAGAGFFFGAPTRYPNGFRSSYSGALALLEDQLAEPKGGFAKAVAGELPVLLQASSRAEIARAAAFAKRHGMKGAIAAGTRTGEVAEAVADAKLGVIFAPFTPGTTFHLVESAKRLAELGVPFGFGLDAPRNGPGSLRLSAAACTRAGLDAKVAWRALTADAAAIAGVSDRVGDVAAGLDADLVLWSGPPTELTSRVLTVWSGGRQVHSGDDQ